MDLHERIDQLQAEAAALREALEQATDCLEDMMMERGGWAWEEVLQEARAALSADAGRAIDRKEAEAAVLRGALEEARRIFIDIGWESAPDNRSRRGKVRRIFEAAHKGKLAMDAALSADAGREMLERMRELERAIKVGLKHLETWYEVNPEYVGPIINILGTVLEGE